MALLQKIKTISRRIYQLEGGTGNNQPARASDVNPIIDWVNNRSDVTTANNAATGNSVTLNSLSGTVTSGTLSTLTSLGSNSITVTNAYCTANSNVLITVTATGTGTVAVAKVVPAAGSFVATFANIGAITGTLTFKYIIL
jgi:hypothetical protein